MIVINSAKEIGKLKKLLSDIKRFNIGDVITLHVFAKSPTEVVFGVGFEPTPWYLNSARLVNNFSGFTPTHIAYEEPRVRVFITTGSDSVICSPESRASNFALRSSIFLKDPGILADTIKGELVSSIILREDFPMEIVFKTPVVLESIWAPNEINTVLDPNKENYYLFTNTVTERMGVWQKDTFKDIFTEMKDQPVEVTPGSEVSFFKDFFPNQPQYVEMYSRERKWGQMTFKDVYMKTLYTGDVAHHIQYALVALGV